MIAKASNTVARCRRCGANVSATRILCDVCRTELTWVRHQLEKLVEIPKVTQRVDEIAPADYDVDEFGWLKAWGGPAFSRFQVQAETETADEMINETGGLNFPNSISQKGKTNDHESFADCGRLNVLVERP